MKGGIILDETILIKRALKGDDDAFNTLLTPYIKRAHQTAYLLLNEYTLAEDAVQEALIQTYSSLKRFDSNKASFKTWFNRIVVNCSLKQKRKKRSHIQLKDIYPSDENAEIDYVLKEEEHSIFTAVSSLKEKYQTIIILYYFQELSISEIAESLGIREGTVKSRLFNARRKLKKHTYLNKLVFVEGSDLQWTEK